MSEGLIKSLDDITEILERVEKFYKDDDSWLRILEVGV